MEPCVNPDPIQRLCAKLGVEFADRGLLEAAFTHSSYKNEHRGEAMEDNERLEFLGDAVLELCVSQFLYQEFPRAAEGELTRRRAAIVCEAALVLFARELYFPDCLRLGKGEELSGGRERPSLLADAFEAFVGALFLDRGFAAVDAFLREHLYDRMRELDGAGDKDYKTALQEIVQRDAVGEINYETLQERGPAHDREFVASVSIGGRTFGEGAGRSKKEAEQRAAARALAKLEGHAQEDRHCT